MRSPCSCPSLVRYALSICSSSTRCAFSLAWASTSARSPRSSRSSACSAARPSSTLPSLLSSSSAFALRSSYMAPLAESTSTLSTASCSSASRRSLRAWALCRSFWMSRSAEATLDTIRWFSRTSRSISLAERAAVSRAVSRSMRSCSNSLLVCCVNSYMRNTTSSRKLRHSGSICAISSYAASDILRSFRCALALATASCKIGAFASIAS
mmetsp:Transcript_1589/g.3218  ORF Transcript_1589/g.3218 Transcript_1589/m.3218 type:complete len:211 (+) Transcript_1589:518-1150(+)